MPPRSEFEQAALEAGLPIFRGSGVSPPRDLRRSEAFQADVNAVSEALALARRLESRGGTPLSSRTVQDLIETRRSDPDRFQELRSNIGAAGEDPEAANRSLRLLEGFDTQTQRDISRNLQRPSRPVREEDVEDVREEVSFGLGLQEEGRRTAERPPSAFERFPGDLLEALFMDLPGEVGVELPLGVQVTPADVFLSALVGGAGSKIASGLGRFGVPGRAAGAVFDPVRGTGGAAGRTLAELGVDVGAQAGITLGGEAAEAAGAPRIAGQALGFLGGAAGSVAALRGGTTPRVQSAARELLEEETGAGPNIFRKLVRTTESSVDDPSFTNRDADAFFDLGREAGVSAGRLNAAVSAISQGRLTKSVRLAAQDIMDYLLRTRPELVTAELRKLAGADPDAVRAAAGAFSNAVKGARKRAFQQQLKTTADFAVGVVDDLPDDPAVLREHLRAMMQARNVMEQQVLAEGRLLFGTRELEALESAIRRLGERIPEAQKIARRAEIKEAAARGRDIAAQLRGAAPQTVYRRAVERVTELNRALATTAGVQRRALTAELRPIESALSRINDQEMEFVLRVQDDLIAAAEQRAAKAANGSPLTREAVQRETVMAGIRPNMDRTLNNVATLVNGLDVPEGLKLEAVRSVEAFLRASDAYSRLDATDPGSLRALVNQFKSGVSNSYAIQLLNRRRAFAHGLERIGIEPEEARDLAQQAVEAELVQRFGIDIIEKGRVALDKLPRSLAQSLKAANDPVATNVAVDVLRRLKNSHFGLDFSVAGVQLLASAISGLPGTVAGYVNRLLNYWDLGLRVYNDESIAPVMQFAIDGGHVGRGGTPLVPGSGTVLGIGNIPGLRVADKALGAMFDEISHVQFGLVLGSVRQANYEGNLLLMHLARNLPGLGSLDITDLATRQTAASFANNITSFANEAVNAARRQAEELSFTSAPMTRAQIELIGRVAKGLVPGSGATRAERVMAAVTISTQVGTVLAMGKLLDDWIGLGDFEMDPREPGFGVLRIPDVGNVSLVPQGTARRSFIRSIDYLSRVEPQAALEEWGKFWLGRLSPLGRFPAAAVGAGFEPGQGFVFSGLSEEARRLQSLPVPVLIANGLQDGFDPLLTTLEFFGLSSFPESGFQRLTRANEAVLDGLSPRIRNQLREQGVEDPTNLDEVFEKLGPDVAQRFINEHAPPELRATIAQAQQQNLEESSGVWERIGSAQLEKQEAIAEAAANFADEPIEFRRQVAAIGKTARDQVGDLEVESDIEAGSLADHLNRWYSLFDQAEELQRAQGGDVSTHFDILEGKLIDEIGERAYERVLDNVYAVDDADAPLLYNELQEAKFTLARTGFWELRDNAWQELRQSSEFLSEWETYDEWADEFYRNLLPHTNFDERTARNMVLNSAPAQTFFELLRRREAEWVQAHIDDGAAEFARKFYGNLLTQDVRQFIIQESD